MKNSDLENIKTEPVDLRHHREALRSSLLSSPYWDKGNRHSFTLWKGVKKDMRYLRFAIVGLVLIAAVAIVVFAPGFVQRANAQQIVNESYQAVTELPPVKLNGLTVSLGGNPEDLLKQAQSAKDLKVLTYDEVISQHPEIKATPPLGNQGGQAPDLRGMKFLQFTNSDGQEVTLGIGADSLPRFVFVGVQTGVAQTPESGGAKGTSQMSGSATGTGKDVIVVNVDGKNYTLPVGVNIPMGQQPVVTKQGNDVYINGIKAVLVP